MVRSYQRRTGRADADRPIGVRFERRERIDAEKVAEVLIRLALRASADDEAGRAGDYLRHLLAPGR